MSNILGGIGNILQGLALFNGSGQQQPPYQQPPLALQPVPSAPAQPGSPTPQTTPDVLRPSIALIANPNSISAGNTSKLTWTALRATACELKHQDGSTLGRGTHQESTTTPALSVTTAFSLTCTGDGGTRTATTTVYVGEKPPVSAQVQMSQPAPTVSATQSTGGATSAAPASSSSPQDKNWCDPGLPIDAFINCLQALPGATPPMY